MFTKYFVRVGKFLFRRYPKLKCIFQSNSDVGNSCFVLGYICAYLFGVVVALLFWEFVILDLKISIDAGFRILLGLLVFLGLGCTFSTRIKCLVILTCIGFLGSSGRSFLRAFTFALIVSGPIANLANNGKEIARVFGCSTILTYNLTKTRFELMMKPFHNTVKGLKNEISNVKAAFRNIEEVIDPIRIEIEGSGIEFNQTRETRDVESDLKASQKYRDEYEKKLFNRCKEQLLRGEDKCKDVFVKARDDCMEKLPSVINYLLCWPMRIDFICNLKLVGFSENGGGLCNPEGLLPEDFGTQYVNIKMAEEQIFANLSDVNVEYTVVSANDFPGLRTAEETANDVMFELTRKKKQGDVVITILNKILAFLFLRVIFAAFRYHKYYLKDIEFDNYFLTHYFKKIDARRQDNCKQHLLPLKKFEKTILIDVIEDSYQTKEESRDRNFRFLQFMLEFMTSSLFIVVDYVVSTLLTIIADKSVVSYHQEGQHLVAFSVNGTGLIAKLMRSTLLGFNMNEEISTYLTNKPCLPRPYMTPVKFYVKISLVYIGILILIFKGALIMRLRHVICAQFYPKREKRRVLYLYNKTLKQRKKLFLLIFDKVRGKLEKKHFIMKFNFLVTLRLKYPKWFTWLGIFNKSLRKCLICGEAEPRDMNNFSTTFKKCPSPDCSFIYCKFCWIDMNELCLSCNKSQLGENH